MLKAPGPLLSPINPTRFPLESLASGRIVRHFSVQDDLEAIIAQAETVVADDRYLDLVTRGLLWSVGKLDEAHLKPAKKVLLDQ